MAGFFIMSTSGRFILVTGGARSGKSRFAVELAQTFGHRIVYIATCQAADREMTQRIARHRLQRPRHWHTIERPADPVAAIARLDGKTSGVILDCLTMYVSDQLVRGHSEAKIAQKVRRLCEAIRGAAFPVILVTNEVGSSVVPERPLGRRFRDLAGGANQIAARFADQVFLMVAGIPVQVKDGNVSVSDTVWRRRHGI